VQDGVQLNVPLVLAAFVAKDAPAGSGDAVNVRIVLELDAVTVNERMFPSATTSVGGAVTVGTGAA